MIPIDSLESLQFSIIGFIVALVFTTLKERWKTSTERKRKEVDAQAAKEKDRLRLQAENRRLKESIHIHRVRMIQSGCFKESEMPEFISE